MPDAGSAGRRREWTGGPRADRGVLGCGKPPVAVAFHQDVKGHLREAAPAASARRWMCVTTTPSTGASTETTSNRDVATAAATDAADDGVTDGAAGGPISLWWMALSGSNPARVAPNGLPHRMSAANQASYASASRASPPRCSCAASAAATFSAVAWAAGSFSVTRRVVLSMDLLLAVAVTCAADARSSTNVEVNPTRRVRDGSLPRRVASRRRHSNDGGKVGPGNRGTEGEAAERRSVRVRPHAQRPAERLRPPRRGGAVGAPVRTCGPAAVMATVCSEWAVREPSAERIVQPSSSYPILSVARQNQGSIAMVRPGLESHAAAGAAVVGDVRGLVHGAADAVAAELAVDAVAVGVGDLADRRGDVAETAARLGGGDAGLERDLGGLDQLAGRPGRGCRRRRRARSRRPSRRCRPPCRC